MTQSFTAELNVPRNRYLQGTHGLCGLGCAAMRVCQVIHSPDERCVCRPGWLAPTLKLVTSEASRWSSSAGVTDRVIAQLMRHNMEDVFEELVRLYAEPA